MLTLAWWLLFATVGFAFEKPEHRDELPNMDKRQPAGQPLHAAQGNQTARAQAEAVLRARLPAMKIEPHGITASPKWIHAGDGFLTGPNGEGRAMSGAGAMARLLALPANDPHRVVKAFVNEHAAVFGHDATALERARVKRDYVAAHSGMRTTVWHQEHEGIEVFEAVFLAHTTKDGELVNVASQFVTDLPAAARNGLAAAGVRRLTNPRALAGEKDQSVLTPAATNVWKISASRALQLAAAHLGEENADISAVMPLDEPAGAERKQRFRSLIAKGDVRAKLVWLPLDADTLCLCWQVTLAGKSRGETFRVLVDAVTGEVWIRHCLTEYISNASYRVFTGDSPTPLSPGHPAAGDTTQPTTVSRTLVTLSALDTTASPNGWIDDGVNETRGNNVDAHTDLNDDDAPDLPRPQGSPNRVFDSSLNLSLEPSTYRNAAVVSLFYWCNWMHDKLYQLGFTEAAGNYQNNNFGRGGLGSDAVTADAQDGSGTRNANFTPVEDGDPGKIQMYIWPDCSPDRDGDFDAQIILHEYTHGLSNRRVGGGVLIHAYQTKGMGEGWSDFYAHALLSSSGEDLNGTYPLGAYALFNYKYDANTPTFTDNYYFGIRRFPLSTDMTMDPLTFKDIDKNQFGPHVGVPISPRRPWSHDSVHDIGELWCAALWDARANLINKHGFAAGNQLILQLVTDAMGLCPPEPSFLQSRDAVLQADQVLTSGANQIELWAAFAKRGMGFLATSPASSTTAGVVENFDVPDKMRVTPGIGVTVSGPVGGPFAFTNLSYVISNTGPGSLTWRAFVEPPLELSSVSGTLVAGSKSTLPVTINATAAATLTAGIHTRSILFSNQTSGAVLNRTFQFYAGLANELAEKFDTAGGASFQSRQLTFTPDGSQFFYSVCSTPAGVFPTSTALATTLSLGEEDFEEITLTGGKTVSFFGTSYNSLFVGDNGYVTFGEGGTSANGFLSTHFELPRISGLFADLSPTGNGRILWQQLTNRVVVSWENVLQFGFLRTNSFQMELFFDGRIRITYAKQQGTPGVTGLSRGLGTPYGFTPYDFATAPSCGLGQLALSVPSAVTEGDGSVTGRVSIATPFIVNLTVNVTSSDNTELFIPSPNVTITAGSTSAVFSITVANEGVLDGSQIVYLNATAPSHNPAIAIVTVHDNETATLGLTAVSAAREGGQLGQGRVFVSAPVGDTVGVTLTSSRPDELIPTLPVVFIPQGATSAVFTVTAVDDNRIDGTQTATLTASVTNWTSISATFTARDNETTNLSMTSTLFLNESMGTVTNGGMVRLSGTLTTNLLVAVISDDESEVRTPLFGVFIPAGQTNASFPLFVQDDAAIDGLQFVRLRALAGGFGPATNFVFVADNDGPPEPFNPYPPDESVNIPVTADLSWGRVEGEFIVNGGFETGGLTGWALEDVGAGGFAANDGTFDPASSDGPLPPFAGNFSALSEQLGNGQHALYQDIVIPFGATNVTLTWRDRIRNHAGVFNSSQQFRVELRDTTNNTVLATLFTTTTNSPLFSDWTNRTVNLNLWRGQTVRLAFVEEDGLGYLNVHLDDVSLLAPSAAQTFFDVYLGTNNPPAASDYLGATSGTSWSLPLLGGGVDYYWQLKVRRSGVTNDGPVWHFTTESASGISNLIAFGSSWRYRNTGQNLGTTWTNLNYADSAWLSGLGTLGFGGGEDTTIGGQTTGFITYYFRRKFTLADVSRIASLAARLIRDDGAIVWINGRAAIVNNMPGRGPWNFDTEAASEVSGFNEVIPVTYELNPSLLVAGTNIVAVEIHQYNPTGTTTGDLSFDLELRALINTGNEAPAITIFNPPDFAQVRAPTNVLLQVNVQDENFFFIGFTVEFFADGVKLGQNTSLPFSLTWSNPPPGLHTLTAIVSDPGGLKGTSAPVRLSVQPASGALITLVAPGSRWSYLDTGVYPGASWTSPNYRTRWPSGLAQLGYGDGDEATEVSYGPDPYDKYITTWFRRAFTSSAVMSSLNLRVLRDDGIAVYLNGTEIFRNNLPAGAINANTLATASVAGTAESIWLNTNLPDHVVIPLLQANNVIAAEVHQVSANNVDISFDLELSGAGNVPPSVAWLTPANGAVFFAPTSLVLRAMANDPYGSGAAPVVDFFRNGVSLGSDTVAPYELPWNNVPVGTHTLTAVVRDNASATSTSAPVVIHVHAPAAFITRIELAGNQVRVEAQGLAGVTYQIEATENLAPPAQWMPLTSDTTDGAGVMEFIDADVSNHQQRFYRIVSP